MASEKNTLRAAAYARFSSDMQRDESIDAQLREIQAFAKREGMILTSSYIDRAKSATTDQRPEFQRLISDSAKGHFDVVVVHKLDRFARSRYDSAHYKYQLKRNGVEIRSVTENLDGSPESIVLESVLEGMAEYYSKNLAREVEKGKRENALKGQHVGGIPPLGYDLDRTTMTLKINEYEADAVKLIYASYLKGKGYCEILELLGSRGYKTKRGNPFRKGSIFEILKNEKYTGVYIYGKTAPKGVDGKYNRHKYREKSEIIRLENGVPSIISIYDFNMVQAKMNERQHKAAQFTAKQDYLLTGKIICGECGCHFVGNSRKPSPNRPLYVSYRCTKKNGVLVCDNHEIRKDIIEPDVCRILADKVFDEDVLPDLLHAYEEYVAKQDLDGIQQQKSLESQLKGINKNISNIVDIVTETGSTALSTKLMSLEKEKAQVEEHLAELFARYEREKIDPHALAKLFKRAKHALENGTLETRRQIVNKFVDKIVIFKDRVELHLNLINDFSFVERYRRG